MTAAVPQPEDEGAVLREKEMRDEASVTTGWVEVLRPKASARLSGRRKGQTQLAHSATGAVMKAGEFDDVPTGGMGFVLAHAVFGTLKHELKDFHRGHIAKVQILSLKKNKKKEKERKV